jgi:DNA-binding CsgD family transcriptional regulator
VGWSTLDPELRAIAERVLTARQLDALKLKAGGMGRRRIAVALGISEAAVRDRLAAAARKIREEVAAMRGVA